MILKEVAFLLRQLTELLTQLLVISEYYNMWLRRFEQENELFTAECVSQKDSIPHLCNKCCTDVSRDSASVCTTLCSEGTRNNGLELNVGSSGEVSGRQRETGGSNRKIKKQIDDLLTDIKRNAVGPDEFQLIKSVSVSSLYERKQVSTEELEGLGSESRATFLLRETAVHTKMEKRAEKGPQYKLAVVTAEGFEDAWRQSLVQEKSLAYSDFIPKIFGIPIYRQVFINRSDLKDRKTGVTEE